VRDIRKRLPYDSGISKDSFVDAEGYLSKNGYYTYDPKLKVLKTTGIRINDLGFRDLGMPMDDKAERILCLGGSTTFGYYSKHSYPELLGDILNKTGGRFYVINGGVNAANAQHIYNMLRDGEFIRKIKPDILIVNTFWNTTEQYENNLLVETVDNRILRSMLSHSVLAFFIYKAILFVEYGEGIGPFQALCVYIDKICRWASDKGIKVILVNEPMLLDRNAWRAAPEHPKNHAQASRIFKRFEEKYKKNVFFTDIPFFEKMDFNDAKNVKRYFIDKGHLTEEGYAIEASALSGVVQRIQDQK